MYVIAPTSGQNKFRWKKIIQIGVKETKSIWIGFNPTPIQFNSYHIRSSLIRRIGFQLDFWIYYWISILMCWHWTRHIVIPKYEHCIFHARLLKKWRHTLEGKGFRLSRSKTEYLKCWFSEWEGGIEEEMTIGGMAILRFKKYKYLGLTIRNSGDIHKKDINKE